MPNAVPKLLHARMLLVASGGFLTGYDDKTLNALVYVERIAQDGHVAALDNYAPECGDGLDKFCKHAAATGEKHLDGSKGHMKCGAQPRRQGPYDVHR